MVYSVRDARRCGAPRDAVARRAVRRDRGQNVRVGSRPFVGGQRYSIVTSVLLTVALAAGCTTRTESSAPTSESVEETEAPAPTSSTASTSTTDHVVHRPRPTSTHHHDVNHHPPRRRPHRRRRRPRNDYRRRRPRRRHRSSDSSPASRRAERPETWEVRPPSDIPSPVPGEGWTTAVFGRSVQGRAIEALVRPVDAPRRRVVVIGGLHGNEPVTPPAVRGLLEAASTTTSRCGSSPSPTRTAPRQVCAATPTASI